MSTEIWKTLRKTSFIGTQGSRNVSIENKVQKSKIKKVKIKQKLLLGHLSLEKCDELCNTYHKLLSEKLSFQAVATFVESHLVGCTENQYNHEVILRTWSQHPIKQVGLTLHSKTYLVRNSDNIIYKTQKTCHENLNLKFTDLLQTQRFIKN